MKTADRETMITAMYEQLKAEIDRRKSIADASQQPTTPEQRFRQLAALCTSGERLFGGAPQGDVYNNAPTDDEPAEDVLERARRFAGSRLPQTRAEAARQLVNELGELSCRAFGLSLTADERKLALYNAVAIIRGLGFDVLDTTTWPDAWPFSESQAVLDAVAEMDADLLAHAVDLASPAEEDGQRLDDAERLRRFIAAAVKGMVYDAIFDEQEELAPPPPSLESCSLCPRALLTASKRAVCFACATRDE